MVPQVYTRASVAGVKFLRPCWPDTCIAIVRVRVDGASASRARRPGMRLQFRDLQLDLVVCDGAGRRQVPDQHRESAGVYISGERRQRIDFDFDDSRLRMVGVRRRRMGIARHNEWARRRNSRVHGGGERCAVTKVVRNRHRRRTRTRKPGGRGVPIRSQPISRYGRSGRRAVIGRRGNAERMCVERIESGKLDRDRIGPERQRQWNSWAVRRVQHRSAARRPGVDRRPDVLGRPGRGAFSACSDARARSDAHTARSSAHSCPDTYSAATGSESATAPNGSAAAVDDRPALGIGFVDFRPMSECDVCDRPHEDRDRLFNGL